MDKVDKKTRSLIMSRVKSKDSKIETILRNLLTRKGLRFGKNSSKYFGKPDIIFVSKKTAVFLDSCFWHGCKSHCRLPESNAEYWREKISNNRKRDMTVNKEYKKMGWKVVRIWEHNLKKNGEKIASKIATTIAKE